jgi:pimeloyl-ACP methyl ester carboxylesterase
MKPERGWVPGEAAAGRNQTPSRPYHAQAGEPQRKKETGAMAHLGGHAVVIGASMGGLLAARALADH